MSDTTSFCYSSSTTVTAITPPSMNSTQKQHPIGGGYFQKQKAFQEYLLKQQQQASSVSLWNMIHHKPGMIATTTQRHTNNNIVVGPAAPCGGPNKQQQKQALLQQPNKGLVCFMQDQLKQLSEDLLVQRTAITQAPHHLVEPPNNCGGGIWDYLDTIERVDAEEHLAAPIYFTGTEMGQLSSKSMAAPEANKKAGGGFLPTAFKSIRSLVGTVFRLPSLILSSWQEDSTPTTPEHHPNYQQTHDEYEQMFFDVDDIDFLPEDDDGGEDLLDGSPWPYQTCKTSLEGDFDTCRDETKRNDVCDQNHVDLAPKHVSKVNVAAVELQQRESITQPEAVIASSTTDDDNNKNHDVPENHPKGATQQAEKEMITGGEGENIKATVVKQSSPGIAVNEALQKRAVQEPLCTRKFVSLSCTPDEEIGRVSLSPQRRKRQTAAPPTIVHQALLTRSTPISVKGSSVRRCYRPDPRTWTTTVKRNKNRKEKQRHEIATNIHEDYQLTSDSEADECRERAAGGCGGGTICFGEEALEDNAWLPVTARNLMEPSCLAGFCCDKSASANSSQGSSTMTRRRNSINFQSTSAYEREFPAIAGHFHSEEDDQQNESKESKTNEKQNAELPRGVVTKGNGIYYFEIPNSPQRRRLLTGVPARMKPKMRTNSVMSSSVASSPATSSFDAGGKFWEHPKVPARRFERNVSECSDDDLIEFVRESGDELADVFSSSEDEDYSSDAETTTDDEEGADVEFESGTNDDEEEEAMTEDEDLVFDRRGVCNGKLNLSSSEAESTPEKKRLQDDLPDSGLEEKRVRFVGRPLVRVLRTWDYAHRQARKGHWEQVGRDRVRFADRIRRSEAELKPVLAAQHRDKVYNNRFATPEAAIR